VFKTGESGSAVSFLLRGTRTKNQKRRLTIARTITNPPTAIPAMAPELRLGLLLMVPLLEGTFVAVIDAIEVPGSNTVETLTDPVRVLVTVMAKGVVPGVEVFEMETRLLTPDVVSAEAEAIKLEGPRADTGTLVESADVYSEAIVTPA